MLKANGPNDRDLYRQSLIVLMRYAVHRPAAPRSTGRWLFCALSRTAELAPGSQARGAKAGQPAQAVNVLELLVGLRPAVVNVDLVLTLSPG
jgi:hypothetical protein